ncbi:MAG: lysophospholipid acyltransferase family protein [Candidatus Hydrogenedentota bacterium]
MKRLSKRFSRWMVARLAIFSLRFMRLIPLPIARKIALFLVHLGYYFVPRIRRIGMKNLDIAFKDTKTRSEKEAILRDSLNNVGLVAAEMAHSDVLSTPQGKSLYTIKGFKHLDATKGAIMIGAHLSNWEWMGGLLGTVAQGAAGVVRPLGDPLLNAYIDARRTRQGVRTIDKNHAGAEIIRAVRDGLFVGILVDQSARENGVPVRFFGEPCWATIAPVMLALRTKAPVHPVSMTRDTNGHYTMEFFPAIPLERKGTIHEDLIRLTQRCQDAIEEMVLKTPGQWLWLHDRWKRRAKLEREWANRGVKLDWD